MVFPRPFGTLFEPCSTRLLECLVLYLVQAFRASPLRVGLRRCTLDGTSEVRGAKLVRDYPLKLQVSTNYYSQPSDERFPAALLPNTLSNRLR